MQKKPSYMQRAKKCYELKEIERLGLTPDLDQRSQILDFLATLLKWNEAAGLISPKDEQCLFVRHFCDSIQPLLLFGFKKGASVLDIGSGGGFPSIPIRVFRPDLSFVLVESNRKKAAFLNEVIQKLKFDNVAVFHGRVESMQIPEIKFDYVVSRGVTTMQKYAQMAKPFVARDGRIYAFKSKNFDQDLQDITAHKDRDGIRINEIAEYDLGSLISGLNLVALELHEEDEVPVHG